MRPGVVTSDLVLYLDANDPTSYQPGWSTWYDMSPSAQNFNIVSGAYNSSTSVKYMDFNGSYGCAKRSPDTTYYNTDMTAIVWTRVKNSTSEWRTLFRGLSTGEDHQVIIQSGGWNIGMYDSANASGFNDTGYSQQSLPGYGTNQWNMLIWRWKNAATPYYNLSYNDTPGTIRGSISSANARFKCGICSIGAYNNGNTTVTDASQYWGDIAVVMMYNRYISDAEALQNYNAYAPLFAQSASIQSTGLVYGDGTTQTSSFNTTMVSGNYISTAVYSTAGTFTWTRPNGCNRVVVQVQGAGGGGASYNESGGAGGYVETAINLTSDVTSVSVTVGAAGAAVAYYAAAGDGGTSSFGSYCSATGGYGANRNANHTGGVGGVATGGAVNVRGGCGTGHGNTGGREAVGIGASSFFGSGYKASHSTNTANLGHTNPGAGGVGGAMQSWVGSNGAAGIVIVRSYT